MKVLEKQKLSAGAPDSSIPLDQIMACYYMSSLYAGTLYQARIKNRPTDQAFFDTRAATNEEALHRSHLIGFLRHLKVCTNLSHQFNRVGFEPSKFHYNVPNIPECCALHEEARKIGCKWINKLNTDPKFMRHALYDFPPVQRVVPHLRVVNAEGALRELSLEMV